MKNNIKTIAGVVLGVALGASGAVATQSDAVESVEKVSDNEIKITRTISKTEHFRLDELNGTRSENVRERARLQEYCDAKLGEFDTENAEIDALLEKAAEVINNEPVRE